MKKRSYISSTPDIMRGAPVITGTRVPIEVILYRLKEGKTLKEIHQMYPWVELKKFEGALEELADWLNQDYTKVNDQTVPQAQTTA